MEVNIKFLSDGRKVMIIGQLNNNESIVQEIFVTDQGDEIPSGEKFTTTSLHDKPVVSFKMNEELKLRKRIESMTIDYDKKKRELAAATEELKGLSAILKSSKRFVDLFPSADHELLSNFLTGSIEYLVVDDYNISAPLKFKDAVIKYNENRYDSIRLISVMGESNGDIAYKLYSYSDGSGSGFQVYPFKNHQDAINHIKRRFLARHKRRGSTFSEIKKCLEVGVKFSKKEMEDLKSPVLENMRDSLKSKEGNHAESLAKLRGEIDELKKI